MSKSKRRGDGEGCLRERKDGRWEGILTIGWENGRRKQKSYFGTHDEARDQLLEARAKLKAGLLITSKSQTLGAFLDDWLLHSLKPRAKARAFESFSTIVKLHIKPTMGTVALDKLNPQHVQRLLNEKSKGLSPQTVGNIKTVLRSALAQALKVGSGLAQ
jgi:integrase